MQPRLGYSGRGDDIHYRNRPGDDWMIYGQALVDGLHAIWARVLHVWEIQLSSALSSKSILLELKGTVRRPDQTLCTCIAPVQLTSDKISADRFLRTRLDSFSSITGKLRSSNLENCVPQSTQLLQTQSVIFKRRYNKWACRLFLSGWDTAASAT